MYVIFHLFLFVYIIPCYAFLSFHVPMFSLLMYFLRNDKNKDDQSINHQFTLHGFTNDIGHINCPKYVVKYSDSYRNMRFERCSKLVSSYSPIVYIQGWNFPTCGGECAWQHGVMGIAYETCLCLYIVPHLRHSSKIFLSQWLCKPHLFANQAVYAMCFYDYKEILSFNTIISLASKTFI